MSRLFVSLFSVFAWLTLAVSVRADTAKESDTKAFAERIHAACGVQGGLVVHLGCGNGTLTAALRVDDRFAIHGLERDADKVANAREYLQSLGIYGPVSVEHFTGSALPYTDNLINLVVAEDLSGISLDEVMRVLAPHGAAYVQRDGQWKVLVKPWPDDMDEWSHFLHDAGNNAVADDLLVGPPRSLQWIAPPLWLRSHETPSGIQSPVSAKGRLFYIFDEGLIGITDERLPDRWSLIARDAFNGKLLWKRPLKAWGWREWDYDRWAGQDWTRLRSGRTNVPAENQRRIVADGDRLYVTLAYAAPMSILDAATGETRVTIPQTAGTSEILVSQGIAVSYSRQVPLADALRRGAEEKAGAALTAVEGQTGNVLWQQPCGPIRSTQWAIDHGRLVYLAGKDLTGLDLKTGRELWRVRIQSPPPKTLLTVNDVIVMQGGKVIAALDATNGKSLWKKTVRPIAGAESEDLFVVNGLVWRGMLSVDDAAKPTKKSSNALVTGWDLRTGEEKKQILVKNLRSPEHHHRCYRNRATSRYLISSFEGAEFLDLEGDDHGQNNWLRGACRSGMMPCNGMLYVPADQCFCQPGSKLLGYAAVKAAPASAPEPVDDKQRLVRGPAYSAIGDLESRIGRPSDWPTYRHDAARRGSTTTSVPTQVSIQWRTALGHNLTAPVGAGGKVFVADSDAHTIFALDASTGKVAWQFTANGRVDSPPTVYRGLVLFGSMDGCAYCLRAADGELVWRFLAAPADRRVAIHDQIESAWPVHGSVLVDDDLVYFTAGRSTYLDGGIHLYALQPATGELVHRGLLEGPHRSVDGERDLAFFIRGANSDVLVSEGGYVYMRQKKMTPDLQEVDVEVLSNKGAQDVGLHLFSTSSLLDGSWYNRAFWMYSKRWPGFQLANQAPKTGQLLVVDDEKTYGLRVFYRRNVHSPMFFPNHEGYLVFADLNSTEPQIVGEEGSKPPVRWLPQSDYSRGRGDETRALDSDAFGLDKMIGYTRAEPPVWTRWLPVRIRAMVKANDALFMAGPPDEMDAQDPFAAFDGRKAARLVAISAADGKKLSETSLATPPVFDGLIAANGHLFASLRDGSLVCLGGE
ncbi:MAG: PQQ-binding-like beta-propeller repeat protein [Pirellulaceae bacterium]